MNTNKIYGALWGAFCADAYALGPHWEYNTRNIESAKLDKSGYNDPITKYHGKKKAGDFTQYGDQMLWLLQSLAEKKTYNLSDFGKLWVEKMKVYSGYIDHASEETLRNVENGNEWSLCGSDSTDFSAIGRMSPLLFVSGDDPAAFKAAVKSQTALTHNSEGVIEAAGFFADLVSALLNGGDLEEQLQTLAPGYSSSIQKWVAAGIKSSSKKTSLTIKKLGQACSLSHVFPGVIHLITKYKTNYRLAMEENAWSGGDSAARGMLTGTILGIINGEEAIPEEWEKNLTAYGEINSLIDQTAGTDFKPTPKV